MFRRPPQPTLFPYTTLFRSQPQHHAPVVDAYVAEQDELRRPGGPGVGGPPFSPSQREQLLDVESAVLVLRSEEHTSELQPQSNLVCRRRLEKKKIVMWLILR